MKTIIKRKTKELFQNLGIDIKFISVAQNQSIRLNKILTTKSVSLIFDIGANTGQFGMELRKNGFLGKIISFEPLSNQHKKLCYNAENDKMWQVAPRVAIGDNDGYTSINVAGNNGASSSIRDMLNTHVNAAPNTKNIGHEIVPITKLDLIAHNYINENEIVFIKIDTRVMRMKL